MGGCRGTREQLGSQMDPSISALLYGHLVPFHHPLCLLVVSMGRAAQLLSFEQSIILLKVGWKSCKSCIRARGRAVLSLWGYRAPDGFKNNLKWFLKISIYSFLCKSGHPAMTVTSLCTEQWADTHCLWWYVTLFGVSQEICQQNSKYYVLFLGLMKIFRGRDLEDLRGWNCSVSWSSVNKEG